MKITHENSHVCRRFAQGHGQRRRRCLMCGATWTVWKKRPGRKRSRPDKSLLRQIFVERQRLGRIAAVRQQRLGISGASRRLAKAMKAATVFRGQRWRAPAYVLISDALWYRFAQERWALYLLAVRSTTGHRARFLPPLLLPGKESLDNWQRAVASIPPSLKRRLVALVSDGWRGVGRIAREQKLILQRCHFHLIAQLQVNRGRWKHLPDQNFREHIYQLARKLLRTRTQSRLCQYQLIRLINQPRCPRRLRKIIRDYLRNLKYFRSYLRHPVLNLPLTTNCVESMNKLIRQQCRPLRTPAALERWARMFIALHPTIACNGFKNPQN